MSKFCRECCEEFKGWCKSFTRTETLLAIVEGILLLLFVGFLVFLILHLISCKGTTNEPTTIKPYTDPSERTTPDVPSTSDSTETTYPAPNTSTIDYTKSTATLTTPGGITIRPTKCTAVYPEDKDQATTSSIRCTANYSATELMEADYEAGVATDSVIEEVLDGELASPEDRDVVLALVKIKPSGITFGCILTVLSDYWVVTAASCLDSIEEVDSLDSFVILDNYGEVVQGQSHPVSDVRVHPLYEGGNKTYDLALLKSEEPLGRRAVVLPTMLDYFKITIGEKFDLLGFGKFQSIDNSVLSKRVRVAAVHALPLRHCDGAAPAARHLRPLAPAAHARCGAAPLCAGVLPRARSCNYCAGAPLMRRRTHAAAAPAAYKARALLGVMGDNEACGGACEPSLYAHVGRLAAWIRAVIDDK